MRTCSPTAAAATSYIARNTTSIVTYLKKARAQDVVHDVVGDICSTYHYLKRKWVQNAVDDVAGNVCVSSVPGPYPVEMGEDPWGAKTSREEEWKALVGRCGAG
jgi:hypothetical protein